MQNGSASPPAPLSFHNCEPLRNSPYLSQNSLPRSLRKPTSRNQSVLQVYEAGIIILSGLCRNGKHTNQFYDELGGGGRVEISYSTT